MLKESPARSYKDVTTKGKKDKGKKKVGVGPSVPNWRLTPCRAQLSRLGRKGKYEEKGTWKNRVSIPWEKI